MRSSFKQLLKLAATVEQIQQEEEEEEEDGLIAHSQIDAKGQCVFCVFVEPLGGILIMMKSWCCFILRDKEGTCMWTP